MSIEKRVFITFQTVYVEFTNIILTKFTYYFFLNFIKMIVLLNSFTYGIFQKA